MKPASAEIMNRIEPSWLTATIHRPRSRCLRQGRRRWQISVIARWPEMRNSTQPITSGVHINRFTCFVVSQSRKESSRLDAERQRPREENEGARPIDPLRLIGPAAPALHGQPPGPTACGALIAPSGDV
jgi:hypothetical protein